MRSLAGLEPASPACLQCIKSMCVRCCYYCTDANLDQDLTQRSESLHWENPANGCIFMSQAIIKMFRRFIKCK